MTADSFAQAPARHRRIFCNRTLNLRQVRAIGYDMDYTLIHYRVEEWERRAYEFARAQLIAQGWPVEDLNFDMHLMIRGLILDTELGNVLKVNSYGYVKQAFHGTKPLSFEKQRELYSRMVISLAEPRFVFLNTLFSLSEACLYAQLVDRLDAHQLPDVSGYAEIYRGVRDSVDHAHMEGTLKAEIVANPERFVELDPEMPTALLDQRQAGKKLLLITNSEWTYTRDMMSYVFDRFLPGDMTWRELFDVCIVAARKPDFFSRRGPLLEIVSDDGLLRPVHGALQEGSVYWGADALAVERALNLDGDQILYVGDHIYGDVNVSKQLLRWRTALVLRELEADIQAADAFEPMQRQLQALMADKEDLEYQMSQRRLQMVRHRAGYGPRVNTTEGKLQETLLQIRSRVVALDAQIRPLAEAASRINNANWGLLMRAGNDKSHLARQIERYADIYQSRVSNFVPPTPFCYMRSQRGSLPHDPEQLNTPESESVS